MAATLDKQPTSGDLALGTTGWVLILTSPAWTTYNMLLSAAAGDIAVSIGDGDDSGPAPMMLVARTTFEAIYTNLEIPPLTPIYAKTAVGDTQFTRGFVSVW